MSEVTNGSRSAVDCVYIAASTYDSRFTRVCVASIRYFYPDVPIRLLVSAGLQQGLAEELQQYWNVGVADLPSGNYGLGFIKFEPLFLEPGKRFLVLDSDTAITGHVLEIADGRNEEFIVDDEVQTPQRTREIYYDVDEAAQSGSPLPPPSFLFNTGEWFGMSGALSREDFSGIIEWGRPVKVLKPQIFKNGEQGIINFVVNEQFRLGKIRVAHVALMRWPAHGMQDLDAAGIAAGTAPPRVIHWAGMKKARFSEMAGADILRFFEKFYYSRIPGGTTRRIVAGCGHALAHWKRTINMHMRLIRRKLFGER